MEIWVHDADRKAVQRGNREDLLQAAQSQIFMGDFLPLCAHIFLAIVNLYLYLSSRLPLQLFFLLLLSLVVDPRPYYRIEGFTTFLLSLRDRQDETDFASDCKQQKLLGCYVGMQNPMVPIINI